MNLNSVVLQYNSKNYTRPTCLSLISRHEYKYTAVYRKPYSQTVYQYTFVYSILYWGMLQVLSAIRNLCMYIVHFTYTRTMCIYIRCVSLNNIEKSNRDQCTFLPFKFNNIYVLMFLAGDGKFESDKRRELVRVN